MRVNKNYIDDESEGLWSIRDDNGVPLYLMIRSTILHELMYKEFKLVSSFCKRKKKFSTFFLYMYKSISKNPFFLKRKDVLIFSTGVVNVRGDDGIFYNRLYQKFIENNQARISIIEMSDNYLFHEPKKCKVYYRDIIDISISFFSKLLKKSSEDKRKIENFVLTYNFDSVLSPDQLRDLLCKNILKFKVGYIIYKFYFKIKRPRLIILEDGFYGAQSYIIKAARDLNILVVEYQHGYVGLNHPAYNYNVDNLPRDIGDFLPSHFLTHGENWSNNCRLPANKVVVGYQSIYDTVKFLDKNKINVIFDIVFITSARNPDMVVNFMLDFMELNPNKNILLRPHPSERAQIIERYGALLKKGIQIDVNNLYDTLSVSKVVVAFSVTTILYESIFFTDKIYLVDDDYANFYEPDSPFLRFDSPESLSAQIQSDAKLAITPDYFWAKDAEKRFSDFLQSQLKDG